MAGPVPEVPWRVDAQWVSRVKKDPVSAVGNLCHPFTIEGLQWSAGGSRRRLERPLLLAQLA